MELTVLVDNNTFIDKYFLAEPALSFLIENKGKSILFDTGYSDIFIKNAQKKGKDLSHLDYVILSHCHLDHTWGLEPLIRFFSELEMENRSFSRPALISHPETLIGASGFGFSELGTLISKERLAKHFTISLSREPLSITDDLIFLGEIPRKYEYEGKLSFGNKDDRNEEDTVPEDSALAYKTGKGLVIITGCSHSGICNIIDYAQKVCNEERIRQVIGGFHLQDPSVSQLQGTLSYFKKIKPEKVFACHCTDLNSKIALSNVVDIEEVGSGLTLQF